MKNHISILIVDDEAVYLTSLSRVLRHRGLTVQTADSGASALELLQYGQFDCIVLDLKMPGMDGLATLEKLRERDQVTPVLLLTGHGKIPSVLSALKAGSVGYLPKPCSIDELISKIEDATERKILTLALEEYKNG